MSAQSCLQGLSCLDRSSSCEPSCEPAGYGRLIDSHLLQALDHGCLEVSILESMWSRARRQALLSGAFVNVGMRRAHAVFTILQTESARSQSQVLGIVKTALLDAPSPHQVVALGPMSSAWLVVSLAAVSSW